MTKANLFGLALAFTVIGVVFGASPVATISSPGSFELRGAPVKTEGVPSWPVMAGDEIKTDYAAAVIRFRDGSRITIEGKSSARVEKKDDTLIFRLLSGSLQFVPAQSASVQIVNVDTPVKAAVGVVTTVSTPSSPRSSRVAAPSLLRPPPPPVSSK